MILNLKNKYEILYASFFLLMSIMAFVVVGSVASSLIRNRNIQETNFYEVVNVSIDKDIYKPGEGMIVTVQRNALQDLELNSIRELNLVKEDRKEEVYTQTTQSIAEAGSFKIASIWTLPKTRFDGTDLEEGTYYWQSDISYKVDNILKTAVIRTPSFLIKSQR